MPRIPYVKREITENISILGDKVARITQSSHTWDRINEVVTVTYYIEIGTTENVYDENDELVSSTFIPDKGDSVISTPFSESFKADNNTFVNPATGEIIKYANEDTTPAIEAQNYMGQYDWFQMIADTNPMVITDFIINLTEAKIANKEFTLQRYETITS